MIKNLIAFCALASVNAVKLQAELDIDCTQFSATNVKTAYSNGQVTVSFDAPSTEKSAINHFNVTVNGVSKQCEASPCTYAAADFDISNATTISATVKPMWAERFTVPFPLETSNEVLVCDGSNTAKLAAALTNGTDQDGMDILASPCKVDLKDASLDKAFSNGASALAQSIMSQKLGTAKALIAAGADHSEHNTAHYGFFPLEYAATSNMPEIIKPLVDAGADINMNEEQDGKFTALHAAANSDSPIMIQAIFDAGADLNAKNGAGDTALTLATNANKPAALAKLQELSQ